MDKLDLIYDMLKGMAKGQHNIFDRISKIEKELAYHIHRTNLAEERIELIHDELHQKTAPRPLNWKKIAGICTALSGIAGFVYYVSQL